MLLTCRRCNSDAGASFDSHLATAEAVRRFMTDNPVRPLNITLRVDGIPNRGSIRFADGTFFIEGNPVQNNPADTDALHGVLGKVGDGDLLDIDFHDTFEKRRVLLSYLRAAYLATFACFGYSYIFQPAVEPIRASLNGHDDGQWFLPVLNRTTGSASDRAIFIADEPTWLAHAVVVIIGQVAIVLPAIGEGADPVGELATRHGRPEELQGTFGVARDFTWPTEARYDLDRWIVAHRPQH